MFISKPKTTAIEWLTHFEWTFVSCFGFCAVLSNAIVKICAIFKCLMAARAFLFFETPKHTHQIGCVYFGKTKFRWQFWNSDSLHTVWPYVANERWKTSSKMDKNKMNRNTWYVVCSSCWWKRIIISTQFEALSSFILWTLAPQHCFHLKCC